MKRQYCEKCAYPQTTCVCKAVVRVVLPFRVVILQHEKESKHAKNTARLAKLISPEIEIIKLTKDIEIKELVDSIKTTNAVVLYPNETSTTLESFNSKYEQSRLNSEYIDNNTTLILIDGSWRQVYGIWQQHMWLKNLPHCHFGEIPNKQYKIRKSKKSHQLSTIEALAHSIEILSGISGKPYINLFNYMQKYWSVHKSQ